MKVKSLRFKIITLFVLLMVVNTSFVTLTLYYSLKNELVSRDDNLLVNRADQLAKLIVSGIDIKTLPIYFQRMMDMKQDIIQIKDLNNHVIVETNSDILLTSHLKVVNLDELGLNAITHWETTSGTPVSAISFDIQSPIGKLQVVIAKVSIDRNSVLAEYLKKSIFIPIISILFMGILSFWLIKRGLHDITLLSQITANSDIHSLAESIDIEQLPDELKNLGDSLNIMRSRLKNDFIKLTQLSDDLAHELRTPINAIRVQNEIILQRPRTVAEYEAIIVSNIEELDKLAKIIQSVLFIARAENKNIALKRENLLLSGVIDEVYDLFSHYAEEKQIQLIHDESSLHIDADRLLLVRVLMNLISNAIKYSYPNTQVTTHIESNDERLIIAVTNEGDMIAVKNEVFTRFWRGDNARSSDGSGLGLSIVQAIMTLHGGEVIFERIDKYNVVTLSFPNW
nr:heavy metal sensor histidine kinase [Providencia sp.]